MRNMKKMLAAMLALTLVASMTGCSGSEKAASEPSTETEQEKELVYVYDAWIFSANEDQSELVVGVQNDSEESVTVTYQEFLLDDKAVEDWEATENPIALESMSGRGQPIYLNGNIDCYSEVTIQALVQSDDKTEEKTITATFKISELERKEDKEPASTDSSDVFFVEAQEVYNENGVCVSVPEQKISEYVDFTIECNWELGAGVGVREVYVNEELVYTDDMQPNANQFGPNDPYKQSAHLGENGYETLRNSTSETNEISFNLIVEDPWQEQVENITVTVPVITKTGD